MNICTAQTKPIKGNIQANILNHKRLIDQAVTVKADLIVFPELSLTGYELELAKELATTQDDDRFDDFQKITDTEKIIICVGAPTNIDSGICISTIIFQPQKPRRTYAKKYLHTSEDNYFIGGLETDGIITDKDKIALAICYEVKVPEHAENANACGANIYAASVVEDTHEKSIVKLSNIACKYSMTTLMANCIGQTGPYFCRGGSSIINNKGAVIAQLNDSSEGILVFDTDKQELTLK